MLHLHYFFCSFILNICFPYTSTYEISEACKSAVQFTLDTGAKESLELRNTPFNNPALFDCFLDTWDSPPLEILVRTSGEARLSEFLMWQVCRRNPETGIPVQVHILNTLWPEFGFTHLLPIVLKYQTDRKLQNHRGFKKDSVDDSKEIEMLKKWRRQKKVDYLQKLCEK